MEWKYWNGKEIFVKLNSGAVYSGFVNDVVFIGKNTFDIDLFMIEILDKFGSVVVFSSNEVQLIKEEKMVR